jgi:hypothetical protein
MDHARIRRTTNASFFVCQSATVRVFAAAIFGLFLSVPDAEPRLGAQGRQLESAADFRQRLRNLAELSHDPCSPPSGREKDWDSASGEHRLFSQAVHMVTVRLNGTPANAEQPKDRAAEALKELEALSAGINAAWPEENRFHFQILEVPPVLVVKMTIRTDARYFVFAAPDEDISGKVQQFWQEVGADDASLEHDSARSLVELFALHRGSSGNARFLTKIESFGCAGSIGVVYDAREWNPKGMGDLAKVIEQEGAFGLDDKVRGFPQIGQLRTEGSRITLPYCWFSAIDTWDNPSLCAVNTYDLSRDKVRFRSRIYNRPDLLPVAKALEYAEQRDYPAVLGYCASSQLARRLVREAPPHVFAEDVRVTRKGNGKERVELGGGAYRFDVERRSGRWMVVAFGIQ